MTFRKWFIVILLLVSFIYLSGCDNGNECEECKICEQCETCYECEICDDKEKIVVKLGIDSIDNYLSVFDNKKVGLITNQTGINSSFESSIDVLYGKINLVALFAPEHGIRGNYTAGDSIGGETDYITSLPIYSLYGSTQRPTKAMMDKIEIMAIDIQDVGARFYTYVYTMAYAMEACKQYNKPFVVFDRPNPVGGDKYEGNILDTTYSSFIGLYPIVQRHGMTIGELAMYFNTEFNINCDLTVIKMDGWTRDMYYEDTNLPWVIPSPNMPTTQTALVYSGTCIFEGTNLSEGRGTTLPFELIGAPYINAFEYANALNNYGLEGVYFRPTYFTPIASKNINQLCGGVQVHVTDKDKFEPVKTGLVMLEIVRTMYPSNFSTLSSLNLLTGCNYISLRTYTLDKQLELFSKDALTFGVTRVKYLLY